MICYERAWAEINLDCCAHNMVEIRKHVAENTSVMAVVKADGYGHGGAHVAPVFLENGAGCLGVAICDEAVSLRRRNIDAPILILGHTPEPQLQEVVKHGLIQTVFDRKTAECLSREAAALGLNASIHIKIDTGMSRLGFMPVPSSITDILDIACLPNISISGIYSHLAYSDGTEKSFTYEQFEKFTRFVDVLERKGLRFPVKHVSNSGAVVGCRDLNMDMVRAGIVLYGLPPSEQVDLTGWDLKRALSFKARISLVKRLPEGVSVSYGRQYYTNGESVIATIPVGYADGYARSFTNRGHVLVGGEFAPVVGTVCMDQFMVDVTRIPNVKAGDEAVLIGTQGGREITADELAALQGTINYEVVCGISKRVPRVYVKNNKIVKTVNAVL